MAILHTKWIVWIRQLRIWFGFPFLLTGSRYLFKLMFECIMKYVPFADNRPFT